MIFAWTLFGRATFHLPASRNDFVEERPRKMKKSQIVLDHVLKFLDSHFDVEDIDLPANLVKIRYTHGLWEDVYDKYKVYCDKGHIMRYLARYDEFVTIRYVCLKINQPFFIIVLTLLIHQKRV